MVCRQRGLGDAVGVEGDEAGEDFITDGVGPSGSGRVSPCGLRGFVDGVVEEEVAVSGEVAPVVGVEHGAVHDGMQIAKLGDARAGLVEVMEAVAGPGHAFTVVHHEHCPECRRCQ